MLKRTIFFLSSMLLNVGLLRAQGIDFMKTEITYEMQNIGPHIDRELNKKILALVAAGVEKGQVTFFARSLTGFEGEYNACVKFGHSREKAKNFMDAVLALENLPVGETSKAVKVSPGCSVASRLDPDRMMVNPPGSTDN